jgi:hypothetical protein
MYRLVSVLTLLTLLGLNGWASGQRKSSTSQSVEAHLSHLPTDLKLKEDEPQKWLCTKSP